MTDNLLEKVEEKVITLLSELETQRKENHLLKEENALLKNEKSRQASRLQGLVSLLNVLDTSEDGAAIESHVVAMQGEAIAS